MTRAGKGIERYDPLTNNVYLGGRGNVPYNAGITVSHKLFAPRIGLAYRLGDKSVIRTGYGINFDPLPFSRPLRGWYPLTINAANTVSGYGWTSTFEQGVPNVQGPIFPLVSCNCPPTFRSAARGAAKCIAATCNHGT